MPALVPHHVSFGKAKAAFLEKSPQSTILHERRAKKVDWPFLERMVANKWIDYIDLALAHRCAEGFEEELASLVCYLSMAARQGHLCVNIERDEITPSPQEVLSLEDGGDAVNETDIAFFKSLIMRGAVRQEIDRIHIRCYGGFYYLDRYWHMESFFLEQLNVILSEKHPSISIDIEQATAFIEAEPLLPEQKAAVLQACRGTLSLITGGPGTGKTYTAGMIIRTLWEGMTPEQRQSCKISLAAPTGKAAANLEASIKKVNGSNFIFKAQTLHQLLKINRVSSQTQHVLSSDIILVDECSMVDVHLMGQLLASIKPGARLILLGDKDQLPSVEAGSLFADLADVLALNKETIVQEGGVTKEFELLATEGDHLQMMKSPPISNDSCSKGCIDLASSAVSSRLNEGRMSCVVTLNTCLRAESQQIVELATHMKTGNVHGVMDLLASSVEGTPIRLIQPAEDLSDRELQQSVIKRVLPHYPVLDKIPEDLSFLIKQTSHFQLLSPMRKGLLGVDQLNAAIFQALRPKMMRAGCEITPIIITQNDYRLELFNGEVGWLVSEGNKTSTYGVFFSREPGKEVRKIPALMLPRHELAYCLSVHKSQGSEFRHVLLVLPEEAEMFGRAALYTGATRARQQLDIWGAAGTIERMLASQSRRQSGVLSRFTRFRLL